MREQRILPLQLEKISAFITLPKIQRLLCTLVRVLSPSGNEVPLMRLIEKYLSQYSFNVRRQYVTQRRYNLIACGRDRTRPGVLLSTHVDTVPSYSAANSVPVCRGNYIYGRGTCDAKGSLAAMLLAFIAVNRLFEGEQIPVTICLTVGEESSGDGVQKFVGDSPKHAGAIVGEPTDLGIVNCQAGFVELILTATSMRSHAFDPTGEQAIIAAADLLLAIRRDACRQGRKAVHAFVHWIEGGERDPFWYTRPSCGACLTLNTYSREETASLIRLARNLGAAAERKHKGVRIEVQVEDFDDGLKTSPKSPIVRALSSSLRAIGREPKMAVLPSWTDGSGLRAAGIPTIVFGPGLLGDAHTDREKVNLVDVRDASLAIAGAVLTWHWRATA